MNGGIEMENTETPIYVFNYRLTEEEYFDFNLYHTFSIPEIRKRNAMLKYLNSAIFFIFGVLGAFLIKDWIFTVVYASLAIAVVASYRYSIVRAIRRSISRMKTTGKPPYETDTLMQFYENELVDKSAESTTIFKYSGIERVIVGKNAMYLYKNALSAYILPNRVFEDVKPEVFLQWILSKTKAILITGTTK